MTEVKEKEETTKTMTVAEVQDDSMKITITRSAERCLQEAIKKINDDFDGGRITRQACASWLLEKACKHLAQADIGAIRADNFNALNALTALVKRIQETGDMPPELKHLLLAQTGLDMTRKSSKNKLTRSSTNGGVESESETTDAA